MIDSIQLKNRFDAAGQGHVFQYISELSLTETNEFFEDLASIPVERIAGYLDAACQSSHDNQWTHVTPWISQSLQEISPTTTPTTTTTTTTATMLGLHAIQHSTVAAIVLAGGQGTRLGFDGPKGKYDIGLSTGHTLFQLMAERILKLSQIATAPTTIPFYIMTSPLNHKETEQYMKDNHNFGLDHVQCFPQGMLPCLTPDGKIIMESKHNIAMAPDGNGGIYPAMLHSGILNHMIQNGIQYVHVFSIDNALILPADPAFIGYCIQQQADCANKVVPKSQPQEAVGVMAMNSQGKPCIVEYSDMTQEMTELTHPDGSLVYGAANICNHCFSINFLQHVVLPNMGSLYHIANKAIPTFNPDTGETTTTQGLKLETFIFDVFPLTTSMAILPIQRQEEFAPVKNATGVDSPATARDLLSARSRAWIEKAGGIIQNEGIVEIAPRTSYGGEGLELLVQGKVFTCPVIL